MKKTIIEKDIMKILKNENSNEVKYIQIIQLIQQTIKNWTWPAKDISSGEFSFKVGYNEARKEIINTWEKIFDLTEDENDE